MKATTAVAGLDPGKKGGMCLLTPCALPVFYPIPLTDDGAWDFKAMAVVAHSLKRAGAVLYAEQAHAFPPSMGGGVANFSIGQGYGGWLGAMAGAGVDVFIIPAGEWRAAMGVKVGIVKAGKKATQAEKDFAKSERKRVSLAVARSLTTIPFCTPRGRDLDGEAEAFLIAHYGLRKENHGLQGRAVLPKV